jgi:molybdopterin synthase catalytic subunit
MATGDDLDRLFTTLTTDSIDVAEIHRRLADPTCGATVLMTGQVRDRHQGRVVDRVTYQAYVPMADRVLADLGREAAGRWPALRFALVHRTGVLPVGTTSVVVGVSAPHRAEAFEACRWCIDALKERLPVWKREEGPGGVHWQEEIPLEPFPGDGPGGREGA